MQIRSWALVTDTHLTKLPGVTFAPDRSQTEYLTRRKEQSKLDAPRNSLKALRNVTKHPLGPDRPGEKALTSLSV